MLPFSASVSFYGVSGGTPDEGNGEAAGAVLTPGRAYTPARHAFSTVAKVARDLKARPPVRPLKGPLYRAMIDRPLGRFRICQGRGCWICGSYKEMRAVSVRELDSG